MSTTRPFMFERSFDNLKGVKGALAAEAAPPPPPPTFTEAELITASQTAYQDGYQKAVAELTGDRDAMIQKLLTKIGEDVPQLFAQADAHWRQHEERLLEAMQLILRKVLPNAIEKHGITELTEVIQTTVRDLREEPRLVIRLHETVMTQLQGLVDKLALEHEKKLILVADNNLGPHDCRLEWADGGLDRSIQRLTAEIDLRIDKQLQLGHDGREKQNSQAPHLLDPIDI